MLTEQELIVLIQTQQSRNERMKADITATIATQQALSEQYRIVLLEKNKTIKELQDKLSAIKSLLGESL